MSEMIGRAYDFIAADYDHLLQRDQGMRAVLWRRYARLFQEGDQVLDFCCGTGLDALFLARRGVRVTGLDASPGMIEQLQKKARLEVNARFTGNITASVGTTEHLKIMPAQSYHGIISAFAGLNTVSDLAHFADLAHRLLRPNGSLMVHMLAAGGLWERIKLARRGQWRRALPPRADSEKTIMVCGQPIRHALPGPQDTYTRFFSSCFELRRLYGLGFLWPYSWEGRLPKAVSELGGRFESFAGRVRPFSEWGRFFVLEMQKKNSRNDSGSPAIGTNKSSGG
ncbi:MAG TPA: class I SAM-dependent methyltransferase [Candidatus Angelobacter sp.]|nr:class I SAM-dependent methyltransferase [Candidatus Angelobacter sp.]